MKPSYISDYRITKNLLKFQKLSCCDNFDWGFKEIENWRKINYQFFEAKVLYYLCV
jgi:hypothetical protein